MKPASTFISRFADLRPAEPDVLSDPAQLQAYEAERERERTHTARVCSLLVISLMPAGIVLDLFVSRQVPVFLGLRLTCSILATIVYALLSTRFGHTHLKALDALNAALPSAFIAIMIAIEDGFASTYYAGLNLILLAMSIIARWNVRETIGNIAFILGAYSVGGLVHGAPYKLSELVNNYYFLLLTGAITIVSSSFYERLRKREFATRHQLETNRALLEQSNSKLAESNHELESVNDRLEEGNRKLRELDEIKSRFFANISHELRTPLTLLLAPLETLLHRRGRTHEDETHEYLRTMQSNGLRLLKLINDLLDLVRLDSGKMEVHADAVVLQDFLAGLIQSVRAMADERRIRLRCLVEPDIDTVVLDRDKVEKVILNLVFNALKFTPGGGDVAIHARRDGDWLVTSVRDTGKGIAADQLANVFNRFWQADTSARRKYQGAGIGLALVKELVEVQGGTVHVESREKVGTTMTFSLPWKVPAPVAIPAPGPDPSPADPSPEAPAVPRPSQAPQPQSPGENQEWITSLYRRAELFPTATPLRDTVRPVEGAPDRRKPSVLVADDEPDMLRFLRMQLGPTFEIFEAVDGLQAVEKAAQFLPDVILCDMMMPEKDGIQVCRELRSRLSTQNIPVILLTARADEATKIEALQAGASDFLSKPFSTSELQVRLSNLAQLHRSKRELSDQKRALESTLEELKDTEVQLVQAEKLAGLGRMSAGIIHEINNPLNFANTGMHFLRQLTRNLPEASRVEFNDTIKDVEEGLVRVSKIISDLRNFSHPGTGAADEVDVTDCIESSLRFLSHDWRGKVRIVNEVPSDFTVRIDRNRFIQVLVNIFQNSFDAMRSKSYADGLEPTLDIRAHANGSSHAIAIRDNGPGIPAHVREKIFDPFFTTKEVGKGTGLGLSICHRIIQDAGGRILVDSRDGDFTEFKLEFAPRPAVPTLSN